MIPGIKRDGSNSRENTVGWVLAPTQSCGDLRGSRVGASTQSCGDLRAAGRLGSIHTGHDVAGSRSGLRAAPGWS